MSRIGRQPINIPESVSIKETGNEVMVSGPKGELKIVLPEACKIVREEGKMLVKVADPEKDNLSGLMRSLLANMVKGVTEGWSKSLELSGTGYRATSTGAELNLALGFSHPVIIKAPKGVTFEVKESKITVSGPDKALVGEISANIRRLKPADPYKAKGFKYENEIIIRKAGKAAKAGAPVAGK